MRQGSQLRAPSSYRSKCAATLEYAESVLTRLTTEGDQPPVEYAVAVGRYLADATLGASSRRVYQISLTSWAWALAGRQPPPGRERRGAAPPVIPLALLDDEVAHRRLAAAVQARSRQAGAQTVSRELSALRSAIGWWQDAGWIQGDPTAGLRTTPARDRLVTPLTEQQLAALFRVEASLREQALWHLLHDTGATTPAVLRLDASALGPTGQPTARTAATLGALRWSRETCDLLAWLLAGRRLGPVFLTERRAAARTPHADVCPLTRQRRMSYRRAAEIFANATRPLDPAGRGWTLHQLRQPRLGQLAG